MNRLKLGSALTPAAWDHVPGAGVAGAAPVLGLRAACAGSGTGDHHTDAVGSRTWIVTAGARTATMTLTDPRVRRKRPL